ncbi:hypothetical protein MKW94_017261 [Papaver nudicaule]|uniref:BHLH domain-containing protein n=1 Tax=Papaver nudicaule TaxID=74823 RepID=A0AA41SIY1_PAPNU|nr:hypothetical protein [Papaver nudicaule]
MEKDFHQQHFHSQLPNPSSANNFTLDSNPGDYLRTCTTNQYASMVPPSPGYNAAGLPQSKIGQVNEPNGWFYCLPRHRQTLTPMPSTAPKEFSPSPYRHGGADGCGARAVPTSIAGSDQKRFLVFDQSGDQTSLFYSSAVGSNVQNPCYDSAKSYQIAGPQKENLTVNRELIPHSPVTSVPLEESEESGDKSEMHEDTEELNALLYSDDENDTDDEEISTGHSPRDVIGCQNLEEVGENLLDFASSSCPTKRKRVLEEDHYASSLADTASSGEANHSVECKDDAESSCAGGSMTQKDMESLPVNKRLRREKVRETVRILQNIIPGGKDKDVIVVIDEAIQYIKSMKLKARSMK